MREWDRTPRPDDPPPPPYGGPMLYWWVVEGERGAEPHDPHQHDGAFSAVACMEAAQRDWEATHPGVTLRLRLQQLDGCIGSDMPEDREAEIRAAYADREKSPEAAP